MLEIMTEVTIISALVKLRLITALFTGQYKHLTNSRRRIIYGLKLMRLICSGGEMTLAMTMKLHVKFLHWKCEFTWAEKLKKPEASRNVIRKYTVKFLYYTIAVAKVIKDLDNWNKTNVLHLAAEQSSEDSLFQIYKLHINMLKQIMIKPLVMSGNV